VDRAGRFRNNSVICTKEAEVERQTIWIEEAPWSGRFGFEAWDNRPRILYNKWHLSCYDTIL
jgi:hypothetical protein